MKPVDDWTWAVFLAAVFTSGAALEWRAFRRDERTLTRALQRWLGLSPRTRRGAVTPWVAGLGWALFLAHLLELRVRRLARYSYRRHLIQQ